MLVSWTLAESPGAQLNFGYAQANALDHNLDGIVSNHGSWNMKSTQQQSAKRYPVPALDKGLDLLEILSAHQHGLGLSELAAASRKKVSEIFRMVDCLKRRGYVVVDPRNDRLTLSMRLFELAHRHPPTERLMGAALPAMQALALKTGQSCHLAVYSSGEMLVIAQVDSSRHMGFAVHVGGKVGLTSSASGRAFLAFQEDHEQTRLLAIARALPSAELAQPALAPEMNSAFIALSKKIRGKGFVSMPSDFIRGITNMSYPVFGVSGRAVAALTIPFLQWDGDHGYPSLMATRATLGETASTISAAIGSIGSSGDAVPAPPGAQ